MTGGQFLNSKGTSRIVVVRLSLAWQAPHSGCCCVQHMAYADTGQQDGASPGPSMRSPVLRSRSASRTPGAAPLIPAALRKHTTQAYTKLSAAATAGAAAAPPLGVELPSMLRHVNFSSGASAYTPSQLLEVRSLSNIRHGATMCAIPGCMVHQSAQLTRLQLQ